MQHAKLSPSSSHRWLVCPGSVEANSDKKHESSIYAIEGTSAHALLEVCLRTGADPEDYFGVVLDKGLMVVDEAMVDGVGYALDYIRAYCANNPKTKILVEAKMVYGPQIGAAESEAFGWADVVLDNYPKEVVAIDYKHGIGISVSVKDNSQLQMYLLGMRQARGRYQRYRAVVVQPRLPKRKPVQEAPSVTDAQLVQWVDKVVRPVVPIALGKDAPRVAGAHCRYCGADGRCPAQFQAVQAAASKEFKAKDPKQLTPAQLAELLDMLGYIEQIGKAVKAHAIEQVHAGVEIPGYEPDWTNAKRIWTDDDEAAELLGELGLEKRERYSIELLSPAQAEKALRTKKLWPKQPRGSAGDDFTNPFKPVLMYTDRNKTITKTHKETE